MKFISAMWIINTRDMNVSCLEDAYKIYQENFTFFGQPLWADVTVPHACILYAAVNLMIVSCSHDTPTQVNVPSSPLAPHMLRSVFTFRLVICIFMEFMRAQIYDGKSRLNFLRKWPCASPPPDHSKMFTKWKKSSLGNYYKTVLGRLWTSKWPWKCKCSGMCVYVYGGIILSSSSGSRPKRW